MMIASVLLPSNAAAEHETGPRPNVNSPADLKNRISALYYDEEYLAAFALSVERLSLLVPPNEKSRDDFIDALAQTAFMATISGHASLGDELSRLLIHFSKDLLESNDVRMAAAWRIRAGAARATGDHKKSWQALDEAGCILENADATRSMDYAKWLWAAANFHRWPNRDLSLAYLMQSEELLESLGSVPSSESADLAGWIGWMLLHMGRHKEALSYLELALWEFEILGLENDTVRGTVLAALGDLSAIDGNWPLAESRYEEATRQFNIVWGKRGATSHNVPLHGYNLMAFAQVKQGKDEEAWRSLQRYRAGQALRASVGAASWRVSSDDEYDAIRGMYERLLRNQASAQALKEAPSVSQKTWSSLIDQLAFTAKCARAETDYLLKHPVPEVDLERVQSRLHKRSAYIGWLDAKFGDDLAASTGPFRWDRWMYVLRAGERIRWIPVYQLTTRDADAAMRSKIRSFHAIMTRAASWRERVEDDPELKANARDTYSYVFGRTPFDLPGVDRLIAEIACYDEWIQTDPLIDANGHYLSERYAVSYSPSASVYVALSESPRRRRNKQSLAVLAIGDPLFSPAVPDTADSRLDDVTLRGAVDRDRASLDKLPRLPYSGRELDSVYELFDARVLRREGASERSINRMLADGELARFDIVHIATHALVASTPERCAIALSREGTDGSASNDGLIDASEIRMGWKLDAELVTLSACQTAGMRFLRGEPVGFAQALFQAGARCVLLSLWKVNDEATSLLMSRFYANVAAAEHRNGESVSFSRALTEAKNWLRTYRNQSGLQPFAHPVYWSGFVLIGDAN